MLTFAALDLLLPDGGLVLLPAQRSTSSKRVKISVKKQKKIGFCWNYMKNDLLKKLEDFQWFLFYFHFYFFILFSPFSRGNVEKDSVFEIPVIPQTFKVNN